MDASRGRCGQGDAVPALSDAIVEFLRNGTKPASAEVVIPNVTLDANTSEADLVKYTYVAN